MEKHQPGAFRVSHTPQRGKVLANCQTKIKPDLVLISNREHALCARHAMHPMNSDILTKSEMKTGMKFTIVPTGHKAI
jgi:hypothetical protein